MPSASSYTNKLRFAASVKNTKAQLPGGVGNLTQGSIAGCALDVNYSPIDYLKICECKVTIPPPPPPGTAGLINTFAGNGIAAYLGDFGKATSSSISLPKGIWYSTKTNSIYIADTGNNVIRRVDENGIITTVAGTGVGGYSGDGGDARLATLRSPYGVAVDKDENIYIADTANHAIRKVSAIDGTISTIAGSGTPGYSGDGGSPINSSLNYPFGLTLDNRGFMYLADTGNKVVRSISFEYDVIITIAGSGALGDYVQSTNSELFSPVAVACDMYDDLYIVDSSASCVRKVFIRSGIIVTFAGGNPTDPGIGDGGLAINARLNYPYGIFIDAYQNVYIADTSNNVIRKVDTSGIITTVVGTGNPGYSGDTKMASIAELSSPYSIYLHPNGDAYIADSTNNVIRKVNRLRYDINIRPEPISFIYNYAGTGVSGYSGDGGIATDATLNYPNSISAYTDGSLVIADRNNHVIRLIDPSGIITTIAGTGVAGFSGDDDDAMLAQLNSPTAAFYSNNGYVYVLDNGNHRIRRFSIGGPITTIAGNGGSGYYGENIPALDASFYGLDDIYVDSTGIYVLDIIYGAIRKITFDGYITSIVSLNSAGYSGDGGLAIYASLNRPQAITMDSDSNIYIADTLNNAIRKIDTNGYISTVIQNDSLLPYGIAVDSNKNIYVSNPARNVIQKIDTTGNISIIAGNGSYINSGDKGPALSSGISDPRMISIQRSRNILYICQSSSHKIRAVVL